jgi:hypothetical protein
MAFPFFQASTAAVDGVGALIPGWPAHQVDDVALLFVESKGDQPVSLSTPAGFVEVLNSPQSTGTETRLTVFWARATSSNMPAPTVADSGDHQIARMLTFRGCISSGSPWNVTAGSFSDSNDTVVSIPGATTTINECLVVLVVSNNTDTSTPQFTGNFSNPDLTNLALLTNDNTAQGGGGGIAVGKGEKAVAGVYGTTSGAILTASRRAQMSIALKPPDLTRKGKLGWTELETPNAQVKGQASWLELETPNISVRGKSSWSELEVPNFPARGVWSWAEMELQGSDPRRSKLAWAEMELPNNPIKGKLGWSEFELSDSDPRSGILGWSEFELAGSDPRRSILGWSELETPNPPFRAILAWSELEVPNNQVRGMFSFSEFQTPGFFVSVDENSIIFKMVTLKPIISITDPVVLALSNLIIENQKMVPFKKFKLEALDGIYTFGIDFIDGRSINSFVFINLEDIQRSPVATIPTGQFQLFEFSLIIKDTEFLLGMIKQFELREMTWETKGLDNA